MADRLTIQGLGGIDGEYEFDLAALLEIDNPDTITQREAHKIKQATGLRLGELEDAMQAGDADVVVAVAIVVLDRRGKRYDVEALWRAPLGSIRIDVADADAEPEGEEADPLALSGDSPASEPPESSGGGSGGPPSAPPSPNGPSPTGNQPSETPSGGLVSGPVTSET